LTSRGDSEDGVPVPGRRTEVSRGAEAVGYAIDSKRRLSATPSTSIGAVDGVADRSWILSLA
jgi:hypothetical protein